VKGGERLTTICGKCEQEWPTDSGRQVCSDCGNDGAIEGHVVRSEHGTGKGEQVKASDVAYRGYLIRVNPFSGACWIEIGGHLICYVQDVAAAKQQIDALQAQK
jgi:hypothetical protein